MNNKIIRIFLGIVIVMLVFSFVPTYVQGFTDPTENPGFWNPEPEKNQAGTTEYKTMVQKVLGYINAIGMVVSVVVLIILGLKYLLGSVEEKAEYKKTMMGYLIGAMMLFTVTTIASILYNVGTSIAN